LIIIDIITLITVNKLNKVIMEKLEYTDLITCKKTKEDKLKLYAEAKAKRMGVSSLIRSKLIRSQDFQ